MSPFELLFCLYYHEISQAVRFSKTKFEEWYESTKESDKARMVITHGKLSSDHFLYDERGYGYFINFENARYGSPIHDLLPYVSRSLDTPPKRNDDVVEWVYHYYKYFPFREDEKLLFFSYLANPIPIIQVTEAYFRRKSRKGELKLVQKLQRAYWHLKNSEYVVMRMSEIENREKMAKGEGAQQQ